MKKYRPLIVFLVILFTLIGIPIVIYVWNFRQAEVASDPTAWGVLGDYFGGILNPIISLASLCVLGYLTHLVAQQTNKESKSLFILQRRMAAFDELAKFLKSLNSFVPRLNSLTSMKSVYEKLPDGQGLPYIVKTFEDLRVLNTAFIEFYFALFEFRLRFGHLFKYNFNSQEYRDLLQESKRVSEMMTKLISEHESFNKLPEAEQNLKKLADLIVPVFTKLRSEVETDLG